MTDYQDLDGPIPVPEEKSLRRFGGLAAPPRAFANPPRGARGPNGRGLCRVCGQEVPKGRSSFCSGGRVLDTGRGAALHGYNRRLIVQRAKAGETVAAAWACVEEWKLRSDAQFARAAVFERDRGVCLRCGLDCLELSIRYHAETTALRGGDGSELRARRELYAAFRGSHGEFWQADHAVPVSHGGGQCGLENLRTLCVPCHKIETAALRRRK